MTKAAVFLLEGYADWELGFVLPGIIEAKEGKVVTFSLDGRTLVSMGGLRVTPDTSIDKIQPSEFSILILPGAELWNKGEISPITSLSRRFIADDRPVAGICAATLAVGWLGLYSEFAHTSNSREYLEYHLPGYNGQANYRDVPAVTGGKLITASGLGAIEFTREILRMLKTHSDEEIDGWYRTMKSAKAE